MAVIGIDLGTTNSLATYWKDGNVHFIPDDMGEILIPSVVSYVEEEQKFIVGNLAKKRRITHEKETLSSFKRFMGTKKEFYTAGKNYFAWELSAMVLEKIKRQAEAYLGEEIEEAIVTVPAYFNDTQRSDTKKAARLAGLKVERLINEPSAAALAYRMQNAEKEETTLLIFDFGGGTLDLSLVECFDDVIEIIAVAGDNHLGGDDIDLCIAQWFCEQVHWDFPSLDPKECQILLKECERAKLSFGETNTKVIISVGTNHVTLTKKTLISLCMPLFSRMKTLFFQILKDTRYPVSDIDDLIMVGGSSKLLIAREFLAQFLQKEPVILKDTDTVVAMGAGIYAGIRKRNEDIKDIVLTDVCPFTLGIGTERERMYAKTYLCPMIERNSTLPAKRTICLYSTIDYQFRMCIPIYQGEAYDIEEDIFLGELSIDLPPKPAGKAKVELCFMYDLNGILRVEATNEFGKKEMSVLLNHELTEEEVQKHMEKMNQMFLEEEKDLQIQIQKEQLYEYFEKTNGKRRKLLGQFIDWYEYTLINGKHYQKKNAIAQAEQKLKQLEQEENLIRESLLFNSIEEETGE